MILVIKDSGRDEYNPYIFRTYEGFVDDRNSSEFEADYVRENSTIIWNGTITVATQNENTP